MGVFIFIVFILSLDDKAGGSGLGKAGCWSRKIDPRDRICKTNSKAVCGRHPMKPLAQKALEGLPFEVGI